MEAGYYTHTMQIPTGIYFDQALDLIIPDFFENAVKLRKNNEVAYVIKFSSVPSYSGIWATTYNVELDISVDDMNGTEIYSGTVNRSVRSIKNGLNNNFDAFLRGCPR